jgi:hypothetical protein
MALQALMHGRNLNQTEIDRFREHGIEPINLLKAWSTQVDRVHFNDEYFEFAAEGDDDAEQVLTMGVISNLGLIDTMAWNPSSGRMAMFLGLGFALGEAQIIDHLDNDTAGLAVFRSPMGWLHAGCEGIVIVRKCFTHIVLAKVPLLIAKDEKDRIELAGMFPYGGPRILVHGPADQDIGDQLKVAA